MTNKAQTMLTIALTAAVSVLLVDRTIESAQAQDCASPSDVKEIVAKTEKRLKDCLWRLDAKVLADYFCKP